MRIIFGSEFAAGEEPLQIILLGLPGYVVLGICWYTIVAFHGETRLLGVGLAGLAVAAAAALILAPEGANGAAWSYVISLYLMAALTLAALVRQLAAAPTALPEARPGFG